MNVSMKTMVSVIVATHRRDRGLAEALESLAQQTYENVEIVLVDDSADETWNNKVGAIVTAFQAAHPDANMQHLVNEENLGSAKTRNKGIEAARGEYVTFLDDDDVYLPEKVARQVQLMIDGGFDYSTTDLDLYNEQGKLVDQRIRTYIKETDYHSLLKYHLMHHLTGTDTLMFRRDYLIKIGMFAPIDAGDEYYLMQRAIDGKGKFGYLPGCDIKAYIHTGNGGLSSGDFKIKGEKALLAFKKQYFAMLSKKDQRYIMMRHHAVVAFAEIRRKKYGQFFVGALRAFGWSPFGLLRMVLIER